MKYTIEEAIEKAHTMYVYETSERADEKLTEDVFDSIWCSMYDVCKLYKNGIMEDVEVEEFEEAKEFLKETQGLTENYKEKDFEF